RCAVWGDERAGDAIIRAYTVDIVLRNLDARDLPRLDRRVQLLDRRLFQPKRLLVCAELCCHAVPPLYRLTMMYGTLEALPYPILRRMSSTTAVARSPTRRGRGVRDLGGGGQKAPEGRRMNLHRRAGVYILCLPVDSIHGPLLVSFFSIIHGQ